MRYLSYIKRKRILLPIVLLIGVIIGYMLSWWSTPSVNNQFLEERTGGYSYINPLLECESSGDVVFKELQTFRKSAEKSISDFIKTGKVSHISFYFRHLNEGKWIGIGEKDPYSPASLLKLPVLLSYLKEAEKNPPLLLEKVTADLPGDLNKDRLYRSAHSVENGKTYTIDELLTYLVAYSDNNASDILFYRMKRDILDQTWKDLGLSPPNFSNPNNAVSVRDYASFFRILYNATYLSKSMSEKALKLLTQSDFTKGIVAGVPGSIPVAHKFGERELGDNRQLHDCGIVYYPKSPYILCIMTQGNDSTQLAEVLSSLSQTVYREFDAQLKGK